ncbi:3-oxoacyl-[acyl-carrier protein] reductase [Polaromonas sp. YR568]|uniref:SDR family NAD(P)-dependent oxidoreductase n=1 Tax=Polaromonas sp. YR568 TaxID=1855301 RepID=UPI0008E6348B|nr:glucose 1-dehydrogenase [Polaromonas sp. YR568]SFU29739.1 3-oxoacyl-[acyl-carrier protein] reductase [Polaromonas sp. YR568]
MSNPTSNPSRNLNGKVAIVTGSSKGIGAGIAERLARDGASVVVNYARSEKEAAAVVARITAAGGKAVAVQADISRAEQIQPLVDATLRHFGRLDILVNNAGIYQLDSLDTITADSIARHFDLNVRGLTLMTQAAARVLPAGGVIVNISSGVAKSPSAQAHIYCATKGAVDILTRTFGAELGPRNIRVVGIAPGFVATDGNADSSEAYAAYFVPKTPLGRVGQPADIAAAVSFAVSGDAAWVTGCTIDVAGGLVF